MSGDLCLWFLLTCDKYTLIWKFMYLECHVCCLPSDSSPIFVFLKKWIICFNLCFIMAILHLHVTRSLVSDYFFGSILAPIFCQLYIWYIILHQFTSQTAISGFLKCKVWYFCYIRYNVKSVFNLCFTFDKQDIYNFNPKMSVDPNARLWISGFCNENCK